MNFIYFPIFTHGAKITQNNSQFIKIRVVLPTLMGTTEREEIAKEMRLGSN